MIHELFTENEQILKDVLNERQRQNNKFGANRHRHPFLWNTILVEEVGEAAKESLNIFFPIKTKSTDQAILDYRKELVEVAAVAFATIKDLDDNGAFAL